MSVRIRYTPLAQQDLDDIRDGVLEASQSHQITDNYLLGIMETISGKKDFPQSGNPLYYRGLFTGFYSVHYKAYIAFYRIRDDWLEVVRIFSMKQDYLTELFGSK